MFNKTRSTASHVATKPLFTWLTVLMLTLSVAVLSNMPIGGGG